MESVQCIMGAGVRGGLLPRAGRTQRGGLEPHHARAAVRAGTGLAEAAAAGSVAYGTCSIELGLLQLSVQYVVTAGVRGGLLPRASGTQRGGLEPHHARAAVRAGAGLAETAAA